MRTEEEIRRRIMEALGATEGSPWSTRKGILELCVSEGAEETTADEVISSLITSGELGWTTDLQLGHELIGLRAGTETIEAA
jgi:hypothetical protein